ncbi:hypothetical protein [Nocardioides bruguierae]|uniref:ClpX-type ZB domain-containing protein n=1 Tax=Nocardioides bruguierae TaxID=2945102 RepID=A0A9X2D7E0_9ACTN|nr:hypothetical protein [Nocardioides bruguierae]MCL8025451.1 hypothetical protein [Nocardioides bruguierae]MCM0620628.1 hypothetical protein [Nocardioides bruguierae]
MTPRPSDQDQRATRDRALSDNQTTCSFCLEPTQGAPVYPGFAASICADCAAEAARSLAAGEVTDRWAGTDLLTGLARCLSSTRQAEQMLVTWVGRARDGGLSWARIGGVVGTTRQAAWERFAKRLPDAEAEHADERAHAGV